MSTTKNPPVTKNMDVTVEIIGIGHSGEGVGRINGYTLFIKGALPGEKVRAKVIKVKKNYGYGKLLDIVEKSESRTEAPCDIYNQCGGCQLQHMEYSAQLEWKRQRVINNLERIGKLVVVGEDVNLEGHLDADQSDREKLNENKGKQLNTNLPLSNGITALPTLGMDNPWNYRNKAQVPIGEHEGGLVGGFYAQGSHRIIDMDICLIQHDLNNDVIREVKNIAQQLEILAYDEVSHKGLLRHVVVKIAFHTNELMVVLVTNGERLPKQEQFITKIRDKFSQVVSICQNINTKKTNVIFGDQTRTLWGKEVIYDYIGDVKFAISARSFYQVNPVQTKILYEKALEYAGLTGEETVIDAYCGIGTISLFLAQKAKKVYGVEIVKEAIEDAKINAELNGMSNVEFEVGKAEEVIPKWKDQGIEADVIVVDPPRKGCDETLLQTIIAMKPKRVVYVSCDSATLARDLRILEDGGFKTEQVQPVDMFPHTVHVECVGYLVYQGID
ncbi:23S rRNA (uracil(1939)-C(5))-methyltransferase RlmD [Chengkuizengella marina]|uniref:23S rRNA (Uracil(1939)-C(5))-methyltransferase RlmD n=1 Tax=Chengkuizengella marina TaxID=2507566 RepID=A0A6N9Q4V2_9BACL|nr:23S rRNA (uracil(1939)-C(5))-methyltransferase RlmD [Chengkuizengella marina]NBI29866.1 23S rRNA (uracil(1939)-C(5))-methyltransferase RlmD [Chengkuizengella marina]